jgi:hypothetical protein
MPWKSKCYVFWVCVRSLSYPARKAHAPYYIVICSLSGPTTIFHIVSSTARISEKTLLDIKCVFWFSLRLFSDAFLTRIEWDTIIKVDLHVKHQLLLSDFNETWIFSTDFRKILRYQILWKSVQWEPSCSMRTDGRTDGRTDMTKLIVAFLNFTNSPKMN